ncbi:hypothetical protein [Sessilibacter corallicola]|uniref:hypothetical protein n=1 Tax=Sessilibacter corallicola TaxID=2904075 RepID=UPI001E37F274|nr:hypothetical protein [Sessilibacter corallicola]MCE2027815.1 hypothetical protein [Sessilibacter corallicola]
MQYTKVLIDLIQAARKKAPQEYKSVIKLTNPDVLTVLIGLYKQTDDNSLKDIIREAFVEAGDDRIDNPQRSLADSDIVNSEQLSRADDGKEQKVNIDAIPVVASDHISF